MPSKNATTKKLPLRPIAYGLALIFLLAFPPLMGSYWTRFISVILITAIVAVGYNISGGYAGIQSFATGALYGLSAYTAAYCVGTLGWGFFPAMLAGVLMSCLGSLLVSLSSFRVSTFYLTIVTLGLLQIFQKLVLVLANITGGANGSKLPSWKILGLSGKIGQVTLPNYERYVVIVLVLFIAIIVQYNIVKSKFGRTLQAMRDNDTAATCMGINFRINKVLAFLISAVFIGLGGALFAFYNGYISPESFGMGFSTQIILICVLGGAGTLDGPVLGTALIMTVPELLNEHPNVKLIVYAVSLILLTIFMPHGVMGWVKGRFKKFDREPLPAFDEIDLFDLTSYTITQSPHADGAAGNDIVLKLDNVVKQFGGLKAVDSVNLEVKRGTIHALIGPNGAGKSTITNLLTGVNPATTGKVVFLGQDVTTKPTFFYPRNRIARTFQHVWLFDRMTALENVMVACRDDLHYSGLQTLFRTPGMRAKEKIAKEKALAYLNAVGLFDKANELSSNLSGGQQKLLELARALALNPELLILDEPCAGLDDTETGEFGTLIKTIRQSGMTIFIIEHHMELVMDISDEITVLEYGKKIAAGKPEDIKNNPIVQKAYLGTEAV